MISKQQLKEIVPFANAFAVDTYPALFNEILPKYDIDTPARVAAFLAQVAHESGSFKWLREIASGQAYEGRKDLGNIVRGDGKKFKGRGIIQITGRNNYEKCSKALFGDNRLIHNPEILATPRYAVESACWFWKTNGLNELADKGEFDKITRRINGGVNGKAERDNFFQRALKVIK